MSYRSGDYTSQETEGRNKDSLVTDSVLPTVPSTSSRVMLEFCIHSSTVPVVCVSACHTGREREAARQEVGARTCFFLFVHCLFPAGFLFLGAPARQLFIFTPAGLRLIEPTAAKPLCSFGCTPTPPLDP